MSGPDLVVGVAMSAVVLDDGPGVLNDDPVVLSDDPVILDDDPVVVIGRPASVPAGQPVVVHLEAPLLPDGESISIPWATLDGSAISPDNYVGGSGVVVIDSAAGVDVVVATRLPSTANSRLVEAVTDVESLTFLIDLGTASSAARQVIAPSELVAGIRQSIVSAATTTTTTTTTTAPATMTPTTTAPTTTTPAAPTITTVAGTTVTTTTVPTPTGQLPSTGGEPLRVLLLALVLTILGSAFVRQIPRRASVDRSGSEEDGSSPRWPAR